MRNLKELQEEKIIWEINITPLTDVFLVLLIIFMIATPVIVKGIKVKLPMASTQSPVTGIVVTITKGNNIYINDRPVKFTELNMSLDTKLKETPDKLVIIKGDRDIKLGFAVNILDIAKKSGAERVAIATEFEGDAGCSEGGDTH